MAEIMGLGISHQPTLSRKRFLPSSLEAALDDPGMPPELLDPRNWPESMREEWADDRGAAAGERHRQSVVEGLRRARAALDDFNPDFVLVWGDDQYENFVEDVIPPFCVLAYDQLDSQPWNKPGGADNYWGEAADHLVPIAGHRAGAKHLTSQLIAEEFDVSYAYRPLHVGLGHAFLNSVLFLDWDRKGFPYPVVPFQVNCYGRRVIAQKGHREGLLNPVKEADLDPPSPSPKRCFDLGAATVRALRDSEWRVAVVASSSWSHAFLTRKNHFLHPDHARDRFFFDALQRESYDEWRGATLDQIEESGQHELLNWFCLMGAMNELGASLDHAEFIESSIMNSNKVIATYKPR
jgi:hypothetical protein